MLIVCVRVSIGCVRSSRPRPAAAPSRSVSIDNSACQKGVFVAVGCASTSKIQCQSGVPVGCGERVSQDCVYVMYYLDRHPVVCY